jgi:peptidoglycan/LPS O-acetylase OafA/YrhL
MIGPGAIGTPDRGGGTPPPEPAATLLPSLAGLRFVAALLVFGFHLHVMGLVTGGPARTALDWLFSQGAGAFSFFFMLSGFALTWSHRPTDTAARFWQRRIARIYPNHAATWLVALGLIVAHGGAVNPAVVVPNLFLVHAWIPDPKVFFGMNVVSWSLACEIFFYALFPLLRRALVRVPGRALWPATAGALAGVWLVPLAVQPLPPAHRYWVIWVCPLARLPEFVTGMLIARIVREGRWPAAWGVRPAALLVGVTYLGSRWLPQDLRLVAGLVVPLALCVGALAAGDASGRQNRWRRWRGLLVLGEFSYAFYLTHHLVLRVVLRLAGPSHAVPTEIALAAVSLALALLGSWLLYRCVERPGRRLLAPRRPAPAVPAPADEARAGEAVARLSRRTGEPSTCVPFSRGG